MEQVSVVLPLYTAALAPDEWAAIDQCCAVLGRYPLTIVAPHSLDLGFVMQRYPQLLVERFDDAYFRSVADYNRLMLSVEFYARFVSRYEFVLIHQTDAYVFRDALADWCEAGYDYVGAPWTPASNRYESRRGRALLALKRLFYRATGRFSNKLLLYRVGNGGLSLRRVALFLEICQDNRAAIDAYLASHGTEFNEDVFFSYEMNRGRQRVRVPGYREALGFAFETNPALALAQNGNTLPFGCHAWNKEPFALFWRGYISVQGARE
jgi:hypothetical protein